MIEHRRLQIDARKWLIGKMAPKKYGDKQLSGMLPLTGPSQGGSWRRRRSASTLSGIGSLIVIYGEAANDLVTNSSMDMRFGYWIQSELDKLVRKKRTGRGNRKRRSQDPPEVV